MLKAVIFDVGGVLIRTHSRAGREKWAARLGLDSWEFEKVVFAGESGRQAQLGQRTAAAHWHWLADYWGLDEVSLAEMRRDFFAGDALDEALVAYIQRLRRAGYSTGLLSNAFDSARRDFTEDYALPLAHFDGVVISAEVGLLKPDPRIYHLALDSMGVKPAEALFVDDFIENIEGAKKVGLQTWHFTDPAAAQRQLAALTGVK